MKIDKLTPLPKDKVQLALTSFRFIPKMTGCYVLTTLDKEILYIGCSDNLFDRFLQLLDDPKRTDAPQRMKAIWFYFTTYNQSSLPNLERTWITQSNAIHG